MIARWSIRKKLLVTVAVLAIAVTILGISGFRAAYAYRDLTITLSQRAAEFPDSTELTKSVEELRYTFLGARREESLAIDFLGENAYLKEHQFRSSLQKVRNRLSHYQARLNSESTSGRLLADRSDELEMTRELQRLLIRISNRNEWFQVSESSQLQIEDLRVLRDKAYQLPTFLNKRMVNLRDEVRYSYRLLIATAWAAGVTVACLLLGLCIYVRMAVILPFKALLSGSRRVAAGEFNYRIEMGSHDELSELASAINMGTESFLRIQRDLNDQVRQRSNEVIRNEQLASVGFLAAGVAHEINNPLASIAWSAEALESRLHHILHPSQDKSISLPPAQDLDVLRTYLRRIQDEAFRCKGITERLLDFSRLGQAQRKQSTDMTALVQDVIDMARHLGQYRNRKIEYHAAAKQMAWVSPQEMKQVVLNLITNALDALDDNQPDGQVTIALLTNQDQLKMTIADNGCGMSDEVRLHLFEPFFTRRRDGRGTGLGLPITSRIIADHGGRITPYSDGIGRGSRFEIVLPTREQINTYERQYQAA